MNKTVMSKKNKRKTISKKKRRIQKQKGTGTRKILAVILVLALVGIGGFFIYQSFIKTSTADDVQKGVQMLEAESYEAAISNFEAAITNEQKLQEKGRAATLTKSGVPYVTEAYRGLGMAHYALKDYEQARANLQQVIDLGGEATPVLYNLMGLSAMYQEDYDGALSAFEAGTALPATGTYVDTSNTEQSADYSAVIQEMKFNRIVCFEKKLDWVNAKAEMEAYIAAYPDDTTAQKEAEFLATR